MLFRSHRLVQDNHPVEINRYPDGYYFTDDITDRAISMDGHFVPNISIGAPVVSCLRPVTDLYLDCHLMIENPGEFLDQFAKAGADSCTVHVELGDPRPLFDRMPMLGERLDALQLPLMVSHNTESQRTAFTVSVDAKHETTTGISAADRATTVRTLVDPTTRPDDLVRPGHIFPLRYQIGRAHV